jgi:hypothetical protein
MRKILSLIFILLSVVAFSQVPSSKDTIKLAKAFLSAKNDTLVITLFEVNPRFKYFEIKRPKIDTMKTVTLYDGVGDIVTKNLNIALLNSLLNYIYDNDKDAIDHKLKFGDLYILSESNTYKLPEYSLKIVGKKPTTKLNELKTKQ